MPRRIADAVSRYLLYANANTGGSFPTSRETNDLLAAAHRVAADLFGAADSTLAPAESGAWANVCLTVFNFDEALTRE